MRFPARDALLPSPTGVGVAAPPDLTGTAPVPIRGARIDVAALDACNAGVSRGVSANRDREKRERELERLARMRDRRDGLT